MNPLNSGMNPLHHNNANAIFKAPIQEEEDEFIPPAPVQPPPISSNSVKTTKIKTRKKRTRTAGVIYKPRMLDRHSDGMPPPPPKSLPPAPGPSPQQLQNAQIITDLQRMVHELKRENGELQQIRAQYTIVMQHNQQLENENSELKKQAADANDECEEYKSKWEALQHKYDELYTEHNMAMSNYKNWNADMITNWIISLSKDYEQYESVLRTKLNEESLDGACLVTLDKSDLDRFGVKGYKHKTGILQHIKDLAESAGRRLTLQPSIQPEGDTPFM